MARSVIPQLMFEGAAEEAMNFYSSLFADSQVTQIERYGPGESGTEGTVKRAILTLLGREFAFIDSSVKHAFSFTPSISLFVECNGLEEVRNLYERLSSDGAILMPLDNYGFSSRFAWVNDRFGVSWQLNLP